MEQGQNMKVLLKAEMERALELLNKNERGFISWDYETARGNNEAAELKQIMRSIRRHSILLEKEERGITW